MATTTQFATAAAGTSWTTPANANADDAAYATYTIAAKNTTGNVNSLSNFGFDAAIPSGATINTVSLEVQHKVSTTGGIAFLESALAIGATVGTYNSDNTEPTTDTIATYSSMARPGGGSWTRDDLLDGTFTVNLRARSGNNATSVVYSWDYAKVTVDYTAPVTHTSTGALTGQSSTVVGSAQHNIPHPSSGALTGPGSTVVGSAARTRVHANTGALTGPGTTVAGSAARFRAMATTGVLTGPGSAVAGSAARAGGSVTHATDGALAGTGAAVAGTASSATARPSSGVLAGGGSVVAGTAARMRSHASTGVLAGQGSAVAGTASSATARPSSGVLVGGGSVVAGAAARSGGSVTHGVSGDLIGSGATLSGAAARVVGQGGSHPVTYWRGHGGQTPDRVRTHHGSRGALRGQGSHIAGMARADPWPRREIEILLLA